MAVSNTQDRDLIRIERRENGLLTVFVVCGGPDIEQWCSTLEYADASGSTPMVLVDARGGSFLDLQINSLKTRIRRGASMFDHWSGSRVAVLAGTDADYGIARVVQAHMELRRYPFEMESFRSYHDACMWLGVMPDEPG